MKKFYRLASNLKLDVFEQRLNGRHLLAIKDGNEIIHESDFNCSDDLISYNEAYASILLYKKTKTKNRIKNSFLDKNKDLLQVRGMDNLVERIENSSQTSNEEILKNIIKLISIKNTFSDIVLEKEIFDMKDFIKAGGIYSITALGGTYIGMSLGELPRVFASHVIDNEIKFMPETYNYCFYIFELNQIIWGSDCFWLKIENKAHLSDFIENSDSGSIESAIILKILNSFFM